MMCACAGTFRSPPAIHLPRKFSYPFASVLAATKTGDLRASPKRVLRGLLHAAGVPAAMVIVSRCLPEIDE